jgi:3',5'-cyclic AMP phosphodiesterase CpdA
MDPADWERTVHCLGDLHAGAISRARVDAASRDIQQLAPPALHLQVGDATEAGKEHEDKLARAFFDELPAQWVAALGNHDILHNDRTVADWARAYGQRSQNFTVELAFVRVIVIGPNRSEPGQRAGRLSSATLSFLERELADTERDCWVVCHWPLLRTVMGDPRLHFTSAMEAFHAKPDADIRALLARHRNAKLWLSGHTHSPLSAPGLIKRTRLAPRRSIVAINASALVGIGKRRDPRAPLCSLYLTQQPGCIEVRCRDHRAGEWRNVRGRRVVEIQT